LTAAKLPNATTEPAKLATVRSIPFVAPTPSARQMCLWAAIGLGLIGAYLASIQAHGVLPTIPWLVSLPLVVVAFRDRSSPSWTKWDGLIAASLFLVALLSRILFIDRWPSFINPDEPIFGLLALDVLTGHSSAFVRGWLLEPYTSLVPSSIGIALFGQTIAALRIPDGIIGAVAVPLLYGFGREAYGRATGFFAAVFLLLNLAAFHLSRTGLSNVQAMSLVVFGAGALLAVTRDSERERQWAILGLTLGLTICTFSSALVWPLIVAVTLLPLLPRLLRDQALLLRAARPLVLAALVAAAPILVYLIGKPGDLSSHVFAMAVWNKDILAHEMYSYHLQNGDIAGVWRTQIARSAGALFSQGDASADYASERGLLDPVAAVAFALGLVILIRQWRRPGTRVLLSWVVLSLVLGSVIIEDPPQSTKLMVLLPAACLIAGIGLNQVLGALRFDPHAKRLVVSVGLVIMLAGGWVGFSYYFGRYQSIPSQEATLIAQYAASIQGERVLYLVNLDIPPGNEAIRYLAPAAKVAAWSTKDPAPTIAGGTRLAFALPYEGSTGVTALGAVTARYPDGAQRTLTNTNGKPILRVWEVTAP
jgi:4-amino-4-deoxy-L-arabinose transferase-like glycosyltransferase